MEKKLITMDQKKKITVAINVVDKLRGEACSRYNKNKSYANEDIFNNLVDVIDDLKRIRSGDALHEKDEVNEQ